MRKVVLLGALLMLLLTVPAVVASASFSGTACKGTKTDRAISLRAHGLSCRAANKSLGKGSDPAYTCKEVGKPRRRPPFPFKCTSKKHKKVFYTYNVFGG
jgi:hypothetical protein